MEKELIQELYRLSNARNVPGVKRLFAADFRENAPDAANGVEDYLRLRPDIFANDQTRYVIEVLFTDGNGTVTAYLKVKNGEKTVRRIVDIFAVKDGKIAEHWSVCQSA